MTGHPTFSRLALLAVALVAVSSCTRSNAPAPVSVYNEQPAPSAPGMITVGRGDTVYELAQRYNVPMREVIELNRLSPPYALAVGQHLKLPTARFYTVQRGDTMYGISRMHQVGMSELARANGLQEPYAIRVGQQLQLPGGGPPAVQMAENSRAALPQRPASIPIAPPAASRPTVVAEPLPEAPQPQPQASAPQSVAPAMPQQDPSLPPYQARRGFGMAQSGTAPAPAAISRTGSGASFNASTSRSRARAIRAAGTVHSSRSPADCPATSAQSGGGIAAATGSSPGTCTHSLRRRLRLPSRSQSPAASSPAGTSTSGRFHPDASGDTGSSSRSSSSRTGGSGGSQATGDRSSGAPWRKPVPVAATRRDPVRLRSQARRSCITTASISALRAAPRSSRRIMASWPMPATSCEGSATCC